MLTDEEKESLKTLSAVINMSDKDKILEWCQEESYGIGENSFVKKLRKGRLNDSQIMVVLEALDSTCRHCFDGGSDCKCWNDE